MDAGSHSTEDVQAREQQQRPDITAEEQRWASPEKSVTAQKKTITNNKSAEDARVAELREATAKQIKGLTKKVDDATKRGATPAGRAQPHAAERQQRTAAEWPVVIGGFRQETPGEILVQATWVFLRRMRVANDLMNAPANDKEPQPIPGPGGEVRGRLLVQPPYMLASCCHVYFPTLDRGRAFFREVRQAQRQVQLQGEQLVLYATWEQTREERQRNRTMSAVASQVQQELVPGHPDKDKAPDLLVCWRSMGFIVGNMWVYTMRKDGGGLQWSGSWWKESSFANQEEYIRNKVEEIITTNDL